MATLKFFIFDLNGGFSFICRNINYIEEIVIEDIQIISRVFTNKISEEVE